MGGKDAAIDPEEVVRRRRAHQDLRRWGEPVTDEATLRLWKELQQAGPPPRECAAAGEAGLYSSLLDSHGSNRTCECKPNWETVREKNAFAYTHHMVANYVYWCSTWGTSRRKCHQYSGPHGEMPDMCACGGLGNP